MVYFFKWIISSIPRRSKRLGLLMRIYNFWRENFTEVGHALFFLMIISMFLGMIPGFWVSWIFCGIVFLFFLTVIPSVFLTSRKNKVLIENVIIKPIFENENALVNLYVIAENTIDVTSLLCFRMDDSIKLKENPVVSLKKNERICLQCILLCNKRGLYNIERIAVAVPEVQGVMRALIAKTSYELLVYPKPIKILSFPFLTCGINGSLFMSILNSYIERGIDFVGIREYREGDSLKDLHHKAFARYGKPFTKEYAKEKGSGVIFVLDINASNLYELSYREWLIRLAAGIGIWFIERGILEHFFIGNQEINHLKSLNHFLESLARIRETSVFTNKKEFGQWSPKIQFSGPVLRLGLYEKKDILFHKQIILSNLNRTTENILYVAPNKVIQTGNEGVCL